MKKQSLPKLKLAISVAMVLSMTLLASGEQHKREEVINSSNYQNPGQLAMKSWYPANQSAVVTLSQSANNVTYFGTLSSPGALVFDGSNIWAEHVVSGNNYVDKLQASDGKYIASFKVGDQAIPSAFDGVNIIAPDHNASGTAKVYFVRASDGHVNSCSLAGAGFPDSAAFDGQYVWVSTNNGDVVKFSFNNTTRSCGPIACSYHTGSRLYDLAADSNGYVWVTAVDTSQVIELNSSCGVVTTLSAPGPIGIVYDGTYMWTANDYGNSVTQIADNGGAGGTVVSTTSLNFSPWWIAYDGANIWTTGDSVGMVSQMSTSALVPSYFQTCGSASSSPLQMVFDGANMWIGCSGNNLLGKM